MKRLLTLIATIALLGVAWSIYASTPEKAPELPVLSSAAWINSSPLTLASLRGHPVLVEFWTFDCSNCRATLPWVVRVHDRYGPRGLTVIGIHSPEFEHERDPAAVRRHVQQLSIRYPVLVDNDFMYWNAVGNRFWPAFLLIDPSGHVVARRIGELHAGDDDADSLEHAIASYLAPTGAARASGAPATGKDP